MIANSASLMASACDLALVSEPTWILGASCDMIFFPFYGCTGFHIPDDAGNIVKPQCGGGMIVRKPKRGVGLGGILDAYEHAA